MRRYPWMKNKKYWANILRKDGILLAGILLGVFPQGGEGGA